MLRRDMASSELFTFYAKYFCGKENGPKMICEINTFNRAGVGAVNS